MAHVDRLADRHERLLKRNASIFGGSGYRRVVIEGDTEYLQTRSGQIAWATTVNLLARLYKSFGELRLAIEPGIERLPHVLIPNTETDLRLATLRLLGDLNPAHYDVIEGLPEDDPDTWAVLRVGGSPQFDGRTISIAGIGWLAFVNDDHWRAFARDNNNPLGPVIAACLGVAAVYALLHPLKEPTRQAALVFSAYDHGTGLNAANPVLPGLEFPKTYVAGAGAVGMAFFYTLGSIGAVKTSGEIHVADFDPLDDSNLNRCILAILEDVERFKVDLVEQRAGAERFRLKGHRETWQAFIARPEHAADDNYEWVVSCVDKYDARRAVQYDRLPKTLLTAGTNDFLLSVSRHALDDGLACGLCYQAKAKIDCGSASEGASREFEEEPDPSIGFVSVLAGALLCAEYVKAVTPALNGGSVRNAARINALLFKARRYERNKDPACGCASLYVKGGYERVWPSAQALARPAEGSSSQSTGCAGHPAR
jgi:molybdopterin/thiamine biosynthesis adenylyltransferase